MHTHFKAKNFILLFALAFNAASFCGEAEFVGPPNPPDCNCRKTMAITVTPRDSGVPISGFSFGGPININVGDKVTWTNQDGAPHTVTSDSAGVFDSGQLGMGQSFAFTFNSAGSFPYHCANHSFMTSTVNVTSSAAPPQITSSLAADATVGIQFSYTIVASGTPAPTLSYTAADVPQGFQVNGATLSGTFTSAAQFSIGIHASSTAGNDDKVLVISVGTVPQITSALTDTAKMGMPYTYTLTANGTPAPTLSFTNVPSGFQVNGAMLTGTFSSGGPVSIGIHATNSSGSDDETLVVTVNSPPQITSPLTDTALTNSAYSYTLVATGTPAPALSFTPADIPAGFQVNGATLSGMFTTAGQAVIHMHATNSEGNDDQTLTITITNSPVPSKITSSLAAATTVGANFSYTLTATGLPVPTLSFTSVPADLTQTGATLHGVFQTSGQFSIGLHASNSAGNDDQILVVTVNAAPKINSALSKTATTGVAFSYTLTATGTPAPALSFTTVPTALTSNGVTISGTFQTVGQFTVGLHAINSAGNDDQVLTITVNSLPVITSGLTATATVGSAFSYTLTATGSPTPNLAYTNVPTALTVTGATLNGTFQAAGQFSIGLHASNVAGQDSQTLTVTVQQPTGLPAIISPLTADALVGLPFTYTIAATGDAPITYAATGLPNGFSVTDGVIAGTFSDAGTVSVNLTASNAVGSDTEVLTITVATTTEGISGNWSGSAKGKFFGQATGVTSAADSATLTVKLFQQGLKLSAKFTLAGDANAGDYVLVGRIGQGNLWLAGQDGAKKIKLIFSGQLDKKSTTIKGQGLVFTSAGADEFKFSIKKN